jgi:hypothetical protein
MPSDQDKQRNRARFNQLTTIVAVLALLVAGVQAWRNDQEKQTPLLFWKYTDQNAQNTLITSG